MESLFIKQPVLIAYTGIIEYIFNNIVLYQSGGIIGGKNKNMLYRHILISIG